MRKDNKGFSLIELIVVVAIMAVLVSVIAPQFTKYIGKTKRTVDVNTADELVHVFDIEMISGAKWNKFNESMNVYVGSFDKNTPFPSEPGNDLLLCALNVLGRVPVSQFDENLRWRVAVFEDKLDSIYLVEENSSRYGYELYPDPSVFLNEGEMVPVEWKYNK